MFGALNVRVCCRPSSHIVLEALQSVSTRSTAATLVNQANAPKRQRSSHKLHVILVVLFSHHCRWWTIPLNSAESTIVRTFVSVDLAFSKTRRDGHMIVHPVRIRSAHAPDAKYEAESYTFAVHM